MLQYFFDVPNILLAHSHRTQKNFHLKYMTRRIIEISRKNVLRTGIFSY